MDKCGQTCYNGRKPERKNRMNLENWIEEQRIPLEGKCFMNQVGNEPMTSMHIRIPTEIKEGLQEVAESERRRLSDLVRMILEDFLKGKQ